VQVAVPSPVAAGSATAGSTVAVATTTPEAVAGNSEVPYVATRASVAHGVREIPATTAIPIDSTLFAHQTGVSQVGAPLQLQALAGRGMSRNEILVLRYRASVRCLAIIDVVFSLLSLAAVKGNYAILLYLLTIPGPLCGYFGAHRLLKNPVLFYLGFCAVKAILLTTAAFALRSWVYLFFALIQIWILRVVLAFYQAMAGTAPERLQALGDPRTAARLRSQHQHVEARFLYW